MAIDNPEQTNKGAQKISKKVEELGERHKQLISDYKFDARVRSEAYLWFASIAGIAAFMLFLAVSVIIVQRGPVRYDLMVFGLLSLLTCYISLYFHFRIVREYVRAFISLESICSCLLADSLCEKLSGSKKDESRRELITALANSLHRTM